jgi:nucleoside phosphorylase
LLQLFPENTELKNLLIGNYPELAADLPGDVTTRSNYSHAIIALLQARNYLDAQFFQILVAAFPRRVDDIVSVAARYIDPKVAEQLRAPASKAVPAGAAPGRSSEQAPPREDIASAPTFVVLTALQLETRAVLAQLDDLGELELPSGTILDVGHLRGAATGVRIGVIECGPGNSAAALLCAEAIHAFKPRALVFVGVAGGLKDVACGDVVVATKVYGYESGKSETTFKPRPDVGASAHRLVQRARAIARRDAWFNRIPRSTTPRPNSLVAPMAAGEQVVADTESPTYKFLREAYSDAVAVEMEGRGFLAAAFVHHVEAIVIRGISDCIARKEESDKAGMQSIAAANAAAFAAEMLAQLAVRPADGPPDVEVPPQRPPRPAAARVILAIGAQPADMAPLSLGRDVQEIRNYLARLGATDRFRLELVVDMQAHALFQEISAFRPSILHIHVHGREDDGALYFLGPGNTAQPVLPDDLVELMRRFAGTIDLVVLQACYSERLAEKLSAAGIPAVGVPGTLSSSNAALFASNLYGNLANGLNIADACAVATMVLRVAGTRAQSMARLYEAAHSREPMFPTRTPTETLSGAAADAIADPSIALLCNARDQAWVDKAREAFSYLPDGSVSIWDPRLIRPGMNIDTAIEKALNAAAAVCVFLSTSFTSDPRLMQHLSGLVRRAKDGGLLLIWIYARPCNPPPMLAPLQPANEPHEALSGIPEADAEKILTRIVAAVVAMLKLLPTPR